MRHQPLNSRVEKEMSVLATLARAGPSTSSIASFLHDSCAMVASAGPAGACAVARATATAAHPTKKVPMYIVLAVAVGGK